MNDFFKMMEPDAFGELLMAQAKAVKPAGEMTAAEWAEYQVLEALMKVEALRAELLYVRVTGTAPEHG